MESRIALTVSAFEQEFIYRLNRARHDPVAYQREQGVSVNLGSITPRQPLAVNVALSAAAGFKSEEMATRNFFDHTSVTGETPNQLARRFGYDLPDTIPVGGQNWVIPAVGNMIESIAAGHTTPAATLKQLIESTKHREHLLGVTAHNQVAREVGIGHHVRPQSEYKHYWTVLITPSKSPTPFLTGVAFVDSNLNRRFEANEGLGAVTITASGAGGRFTTTALAAGGWSMAVPAGDYVVTATGGTFSGTSSATVRVGTQNVAVDFLSGLPAAWVNFAQPVFTSQRLVGNVEFGTIPAGYALRAGGGDGKLVPVTINGAIASASNPGSGWVAVGARQIGGGYDLVWRRAPSGTYAAWTLNAAGARTGGRGLSLAHVQAIEAQMAFDITGEGRIGFPVVPFTSLQVVGVVELGTIAQGYALRVGGMNGQVIPVRWNGGPASTSRPGGGWQAVAGWQSGGGYEILWVNEAKEAYASWTLDESGAHVTGRALSLQQVPEVISNMPFMAP